MKIYSVKNLEEFNELNLTNRADDVVYEKMESVKKILDEVKNKKDEALCYYTKKFDGVKINPNNIKVSNKEIEEAYKVVGSEFIEAIKYAITNVTLFHKEQKPKDFEVMVDGGICLGRKWLPIDTVGLYVPGGKAPYVTVCYMLGVPAKIAGCKNIALCTPPNKETGEINPYILVSANLAGIENIYKVGGAQAIGAMAYGTETVPKVGKVFGPGNVYVTASKLAIYGKVDIDALAGPSEALIIADEESPVTYVAADLISQAEHGNDSAALLLTFNEDYAKKVSIEVDKQINSLNRKENIKNSLEKYGAIIVCDSKKLSIDIANEYAPEHIQIMDKDYEETYKQIKNAGSICIGNYSPIAMGDYLAGVNNVIPTGGLTKNFSPVHVEGFMKCIQTQHTKKEGLEKSKEYLKIISDVEGFDAHYNSIKVRT